MKPTQEPIDPKSPEEVDLFETLTPDEILKRRESLGSDPCDSST